MSNAGQHELRLKAAKNQLQRNVFSRLLARYTAIAVELEEARKQRCLLQTLSEIAPSKRRTMTPLPADDVFLTVALMAMNSLVEIGLFILIGMFCFERNSDWP